MTEYVVTCTVSMVITADSPAEAEAMAKREEYDFLTVDSVDSVESDDSESEEDE